MMTMKHSDYETLQSLNESLSCPICLELCQDAVECTQCHNVYCHECSSSLDDKRCAICRERTQFAVSFVARRLINTSPANCAHCNSAMARGDLKEHLKRCDKSPIECPLCSEKIKKEESLNHLSLRHRQETFGKLETIFGLFIDKNNNLLADNNSSDSIDTQMNSKRRQARLGSSGKFYCGGQLDGERCKCCNNYCGPTNGCNCSACMQLDIEQRKLPQGWLVNKDGFTARRSAKNGMFYCGRRVLVGVPGCDGYCGPNDGPSCDACRKLDAQTTTGARYAHLIKRSDAYRV